MVHVIAGLCSQPSATNMVVIMVLSSLDVSNFT